MSERKGYMIPNNLFTSEAELAEFSDQELGHLFRAIVHMSQGWSELETSREENRIIKEWKLFDDMASKSYEASVANGKKGGRPKKENLEKPKETLGYSQEPNVTQKNQYEYEDDTEYIYKYSSNELLRAKVKEFIAHRKRIKKPVKDIKNLLNRLSKIATTDEEKIQVLSESIENEYQGIFPLKKASGINNKAQIIEHSYQGVEVNDPRKAYRK